MFVALHEVLGVQLGPGGYLDLKARSEFGFFVSDPPQDGSPKFRV